MIEEDDKRLVFVPVEKLSSPPEQGGFLEHYYKHFWSVHPEKGVLFWRVGKSYLAPQCNPSVSIANQLRETLYPWAETRLIEHAFWSHNCSDYL